ncbi:helix-turn-helix domain-containing protein [Arthrobacter bambusae]|uniref:GAF domain-containing protein/sugar diacid utilization regulator n=1 Tax=Arthrobacter bambusae TaxID=1338426 RepID=A0AAW8DK87_9MICC|nr:GAF domain-containing protein [Arthrobacter bambusae]MDP9906054.1 GAF domain-containing protein/sugar diacid utilization regulator [Arthrobacter bambusae]MDQ0131151.1 GAF domain-containing protein/sugar diacid utilization regulator [Arthrobacter bambusae]MDQ0181857.1 GAF domain-containing protein/sugar diacid utilization regulator [Arthrobacter bambusae]
MAQHLQGWLKALAHIGAAVNRGVSLSELLDLIAKTACELLSYDFCAITIPDAASQVLVIEGSYGLSAEYIRDINERHPVRLHGVHTPSPSGQAFALGVPVQIEDFGSNPTMLAWRAAARDQGYSSMISVPLNSSDETLGTLNCYTRLTHHFTREEESRLLMLADQAAVAITTSRLRSEQATRITVLKELNESLEEQYELQRNADAIHERLTALTLEGGGVRALGGALAEILDRPVAVCETNGTILYNTERDGISLPATLLANAAGLPLPDVMSAGNAGFLADVRVPDTTGMLTVVRVPVMIKEKVVAWIWTSGKLSELRPLDRQAMERAAAPLALELLRTRTATQAEWRDTGEILSGLLSGRGHGTALLAQAARLGHDLSLPHAVVAVRFETGNEGALPYWLAATFTRMALQVSPKPLLGSHEGYVVALWPLGPLTPIDEVRGIGDELRRIPSEGVQNTDRAHGAITGPVTSIADYPAAFATARGAVELAALRKSSPGTLVLGDLGLTGLLLQLPDVSALSHYTDDVLGPLRANHLARDPSLLPTLSALIHNDLNASKTAEQLHVQKDIVVEARRRIEDLLALNLSRVSDLTRISMALEVDNVIEARQRQRINDV